MKKTEAERRSPPRGTPPRGRARPKPKKSPDPKPYRPGPYPYEIRRRAVQLYLEEGIGAELVAKELGLSGATVHDWAKRYKQYGEEGLRHPWKKGGKPKLPKAVKEKIAELKRSNPRQGSKRISQVLKRFFWLKASPETVRRELKAAGTVKPKPKPRRKPKPPARRFEASKPNQMWQTDITYYPILGKMAYIIGFIDDHSRYITALGLYRSQTSENVVETYRMATGAFGLPKEMLTDNGRQYASWRGMTKFQKELKKDHIHHIRSSPHHPMTLGKIERFWQTLKEEYLERARFESFEEARERLAYWVKYYNHKRPHQGLEGMVPADRFFSIQKEMKAAIERGVAANVEELALRGKPKEPFYMVGRIGDRSVVIETDQKRVSVMVDGQELKAGEAITYEGSEHEAGAVSGKETEAEEQSVQREREDTGGAVAVEREAERVGTDAGNGSAVGAGEQLGEAGAFRDAPCAGPEAQAGGGGSSGAAGAAGEAAGSDIEAGKRELKGEEHEDTGTGTVQRAGEMPGGAGSMDGEEKGIGAVPGNGSECGAVFAVAGPGAFGHTGVAGAAGNEGRPGEARTSGADQETAGAEVPRPGAGSPGPECRLEACAENPEAGSVCDGLLKREVISVGISEGTEADAGDPGASGRTPECHGGGTGAGDQPENVLRMAGPCAGGDLPGDVGPAHRPSPDSGGCGEGPADAGAGGAGTGAHRAGGPSADTGGDSADGRGHGGASI